MTIKVKAQYVASKDNDIEVKVRFVADEPERSHILDCIKNGESFESWFVPKEALR